MKRWWAASCIVALAVSAGCGVDKPVGGVELVWAVHDMQRPQPRVVAPGVNPGDPPSDALVLFDGSDMSRWQDGKGNAPRWKVENDYMEITRTGSIQTRDAFGSCQLHIEWCAPEAVKGEGQGRGNSGVYLMGRYEIQVLDSYDNETYADGQAAALYGQSPPLVNVCRGPGEWQVYDIIFRRPVFDSKGQVTRKARVMVFHNGVLVQDNVALWGTTTHKRRAQYGRHAERLPLSLQDHGNPVRYRNIWIRELGEPEATGPGGGEAAGGPQR